MRVNILYYTVVLVLTDFCRSQNTDEPDLSVNYRFTDESSAQIVDAVNETYRRMIKKGLEEKLSFKNDQKSRRYRIISGNERLRASNDFEEDFDFKSNPLAVRRIIGGMETSISIFPYNVAISRGSFHWCGGSIIDEQWVLSAGHCMEPILEGGDYVMSNFKIRSGSSYHNRGGYQAFINKVFFHSKYVPQNADYDFSLIRLDRPLPIGKNIAVVNLPSPDFYIQPSDILVVTGWGSTDPSGFRHIPDRLRFVPVPTMNMDTCQNSYKFYITPRMLCAGYASGGKDACNHDSGGPAVHNNVLLGVVSFGGKICGDPRAPGVYSRVSTVTDWVEETISNNEAYEVPELIPKIKEAREKEKKMKVINDKLNSNNQIIKDWLRKAVNSSAFIRVAKKKLKEIGYIKEKED